MPIRKVSGGYKWGGHGHVYPNRAGAERQAAAAHAHGYTGDNDMAPNDFGAVLNGLAGLGRMLPALSKFFREESQEPEHSEDAYSFSDFAQDPLTDKGQKIMRSMQDEYGAEKGKQVFYASRNAGKISGTDAASHSELAQRIKREYERGHPLKQAIAIAYHELGGDSYLCNNEHSDFCNDTPYMDNPPDAAGMICAKDGKVLFMKRSGKGDQGGKWAFPGGMIEKGEEAADAAVRELEEETGYKAGDCQPIGGDEAIDCEVAADGPHVNWTAFVHHANDLFEPRMDGEHTDYKWATLDEAPQPLHPGVTAMLANESVRKALDAAILAPSSGIPVGKTRVTEHESEPDTAAQDSACLYETLAFDKKSIRDIDQDGRLHVGLTPISKACVNPYIGHEIPEFEKLGLEPDKVYKLLRHPAELQRSARSFNGVPLLREHVPHSSDEHDPDLVAGSTGNDTVYQHPYLMNTLSVWPQDAIDRINNDKQRELSSSYHYRADMTPGVYEGEPYDGIMRDIVGNHVALVKEGRAGSDVVVGDSALGGATTSQRKDDEMDKVVLKSRRAYTALGTIDALLRPKLAADKKFDAAPLLVDLSAKTWTTKWPQVIDAIKTGTKGLLAKDAGIEDILPLLASLQGGEQEGDEINPANPGMPDEHHATIDANPGGLGEFLKGKLSPEDHARALQMMGGNGGNTAITGDESEEEKKKREEAEAKDRKAKDEPPDFKGKPAVGGGSGGGEETVTKGAMDAAISAAVKGAKAQAVQETMSTQRAIREAEKAVRPWVGDIALACDSADAVYKAALDALKVDVTDVHPSAYSAILKAQPIPGEKKDKNFAADSRLGMDAAQVSDFNKRFPGVSRLRHV